MSALPAMGRQPVQKTARVGAEYRLRANAVDHTPWSGAKLRNTGLTVGGDAHIAPLRTVQMGLWFRNIAPASGGSGL